MVKSLEMLLLDIIDRHFMVITNGHLGYLSYLFGRNKNLKNMIKSSR